MPDNNAKIRSVFNQFDQIIADLPESYHTHDLKHIRLELQALIETLSVSFVKEAVEYYLRNIEDEPLYQKIKALNKDEVAKRIGRSRSYVYNAIRKKSFSKFEFEKIHSMMDDSQW